MLPALHDAPGPRGYSGPGRSGTVTVEFALVAPLLVLLLFGIIEFGLVFRDLLSLNQAAREAARTASVGSPTDVITQTARDAARGLRAPQITVLLDYRVYTTGGWSDWTTLGNLPSDPPVNDAPRGAQIRVRLRYPHHLVTGALFSRFFSANGTATVPLRSSMLIRRE